MDDSYYMSDEQNILTGFFDTDISNITRESPLVLRTAISGMKYHIDPETEEGKKILESLTPGTEVRLFRDPDNEHDRWAVAVYSLDDVELGYITRFKNETISRLMDYGKRFTAFVIEHEDPLSEIKMEGRELTPSEERTIIRRNIAPTEISPVWIDIFMED